MSYLIRLIVTFRIVVNNICSMNFFIFFSIGSISFEKYGTSLIGVNVLINSSMSRVQNTSLQNHAFLLRARHAEIRSFLKKLLWLDRKLHREYFALQGDTIIVVQRCRAFYSRQKLRVWFEGNPSDVKPLFDTRKFFLKKAIYDNRENRDCFKVFTRWK